MMKIRSYIELMPEEEILLAEHFEVLDSAIGAEIVIVKSPINFDMYLDEKSYPDLKIIASQGQREGFIRGTSDGRNIEVIMLGNNIIHDLIKQLI